MPDAISEHGQPNGDCKQQHRIKKQKRIDTCFAGTENPAASKGKGLKTGWMWKFDRTPLQPNVPVQSVNNILNMNNYCKVQYAHDLIHLAFDINSKRQRYPLQITTQIFNQN